MGGGVGGGYQHTPNTRQTLKRNTRKPKQLVGEGRGRIHWVHPPQARSHQAGGGVAGEGVGVRVYRFGGFVEGVEGFEA